MRKKFRKQSLRCGIFLLLFLASAGCRRETEAVVWTQGSESTAAREETQTASVGTIVVHLCGEVRSPGIYELAQGSRLYEAVEAAGGMTEEAAADYLNLARILNDGEKIRIPDREAAAQEPFGPEALPGQDPGAEEKVNLNTADAARLQTLPGIGEAKAGAILAYREEHGKFSSIEEIKQVSGIGEAVYENLKEHITV
jgi:competence protein ComEA